MNTSKTKAGFWCPSDIQAAVQIRLDRGEYADQSKALVALLRAGIKAQEQFPNPLRAQIHDLAGLLQRSEDTVIRQCVEGIMEMLHAPESDLPLVTVTPLIVEEVSLRRKRLKG